MYNLTVKIDDSPNNTVNVFATIIHPEAAQECMFSLTNYLKKYGIDEAKKMVARMWAGLITGTLRGPYEMSIIENESRRENAERCWYGTMFDRGNYTLTEEDEDTQDTNQHLALRDLLRDSRNSASDEAEKMREAQTVAFAKSSSYVTLESVASGAITAYNTSEPPVSGEPLYDLTSELYVHDLKTLIVAWAGAVWPDISSRSLLVNDVATALEEQEKLRKEKVEDLQAAEDEESDDDDDDYDDEDDDDDYYEDEDDDDDEDEDEY